MPSGPAAVTAGLILYAVAFAALLVTLTDPQFGCAEGDAADHRPTVAVAEETCLDCHRETVGLASDHDPAQIGCVSCHLGDAADPTEEGSHEGMVSVPGNLAAAAQTCGTPLCHPGIVARVDASMMATARGIVAVDRWVFGEIGEPNGLAGLDALGDSPADEHLRQLCYTCHLALPKEEPAPITELSRGGGCTACHVDYHLSRADSTHHPRLTVQATDDHCFGCHSRSGRITLNYAGWHETLLTPADVAADDTTYRQLDDGRVVVRRPRDVHHEADLACIDCHTSRETMGDGQRYLHQNQATEVECSTCHRTETPATVGWDGLDRESRLILELRYEEPPTARRFVTLEKTGAAMTNVFVGDDGGLEMVGKLNGRRYALAPPVEACRQPGHDRVSCQSCHSAWVPQCVGCHTQLDRDGQWREFASDFFAEAPTLGLYHDPVGDTLRVEPFVPGMIMTLNREPRSVLLDVEELAAEGTFHRLFAPSVPHTTAAAGRSCASCHLDPVAVGFGRGTLTLEGGAASPQWVFEPSFRPMRDGLPADAWVPLLGLPEEPWATRTGSRPFDRAEQQRILRVGACLTCHDPETPQGRALYDDFDGALTRVTGACRVPPVVGP